MSDLAIVIPAYKEEFFDKALESLAQQTNKNFTVYIGDDCSPNNIKSIANRFIDRINLEYTRFDDNIGSKNIVQQWKRCVQLSRDEKWIWLFSDDDIVDVNAVENFYNIQDKNKGRFEVYRFNTYVIDKAGKTIHKSNIGPQEESSEQMAFNLLLGLRGNSMPDHIFSRQVYNRNNGFVETEFAQAADWATSILFSKDKGICIIPDSILYWRLSGANISSIAAEKSKQMLIGHLQFILWVLDHFKYLNYINGPIKYEMIKEAAIVNLRNVIINHYKAIDNNNIPRVLWLLHDKLGMSYISAAKFIYYIKRNTSSRLNYVVDFVKGVKRGQHTA